VWLNKTACPAARESQDLILIKQTVLIPGGEAENRENPGQQKSPHPERDGGFNEEPNYWSDSFFPSFFSAMRETVSPLISNSTLRRFFSPPPP